MDKAELPITEALPVPAGICLLADFKTYPEDPNPS
jgi:hypothetical protein